MRLVDDFVIGFDEVSEAEDALGILRDALWEYNLQLNDSKTSIVPTTDVYEDRISLVGRLFIVREKTTIIQRRDIIRLLDLTLDQCKYLKNANPAVSFCRRMYQLHRPQFNLALILQSMFRLGRDYPTSISYISEFLINRRQLVIEENLVSYVENWVRRTLKRHSGHSHDFEVSWTLIVAGVFGVVLNKDDFPNGEGIGGVALAILGLLRQRKLLKVPLAFWGWKKNFKARDVFEENWLFYYEFLGSPGLDEGR